MAAGDDVAGAHLRNGAAGHAPPRRRRRGRIGGDGADEGLPSGQLSEARPPAACGVHDLAVAHLELRAVDRPLPGGQVDERVAGRARHRPQLGAHDRCRAAAEGPLVVGREVGVAHDEADGAEGRPQLLGHRLGERGADVLAELDLARVDRDDPVGADVEPGGERSRRPAPAFVPPPGLLGRRLRGQQHHQAAAHELDELAAVEREAVGRPGEQLVPLRLDPAHREAFGAAAARRTARTIRA